MQIEDGGTSKDDACFYDYLILVDGSVKGSPDNGFYAHEDVRSALDKVHH